VICGGLEAHVITEHEKGYDVVELAVPLKVEDKVSFRPDSLSFGRCKDIFALRVIHEEFIAD